MDHPNNLKGISSLVIASFLLLSISAHASSSHKVSRFEYDGYGNQVKASVYDRTDAGETLVAETETEYDGFNNVVLQTQKRVLGYDRIAAITTYDTIVQKYAYEDTAWPTKVTHKYNPRWPDDPAMAEQIYYDSTTGQVKLSFSSDYYCTNIPWYSAAPIIETFALERSGDDTSVTIKGYDWCRASAYSYESLGRPTEIKSLLSPQYQVYDGSLPQYLDHVWLETNMEYYLVTDTQKGALKTAIKGASDEPLRAHMAYDWDAVGNLTAVTDNGYTNTVGTVGALGHTNTAEYDTMRRVTRTTDPEGGESQYMYDAAGQLRNISAKIDTGKWAVTYAQYYADGRLKNTTDPDGDITSYTYDTAGRSDVVTDGADRKTKSIYYPNGQIKCTIRGYESTLAQAYSMFDYAADGQVKAQRPAKGVTLTGPDLNSPTGCEATDGQNGQYDTTYSYDGYRRLFETVYPDRTQDAGQAYATTSGHVRGAGHTFTRQWLDQGGNAFQQRTRKGDSVTNYYTVNGEQYQRETLEAKYENFYLGIGSPYFSRIIPKIGTTYDFDYRRYSNHAYDSLGRTIYEQIREKSPGTDGPTPYTSVYYDVAGNMERMIYTGGAYTKYAYNKNKLMTNARFSGTGDPAVEKQASAFYYDLMSRRTHAYKSDSLATHVNGTPSYAVQQFNYDADSDLKGVVSYWSDPSLQISTLTNLHLKYDQDGSGKITKAYADLADTANADDWRYTPTTKTQNYAGTNDLDQYGTVDLGDGAGAQVQTFDGAGNLTSDGLGRTFTYNSENQLVTAIGTNGGASFNMEYWYDGEGRRTHSIDHTANTETFHKHLGAMEISDYAVCRTALIAAVCPATNTVGVGPVVTYTPTFRILIGQSVDERIAYHNIAGDDLYFYLTNHQGSTIAMTNEDGIRRADADGGRYVYDPYGQDGFKGTANEVSMSGNPYRYTGRRLDAQTGLYYYRARYYSPEQGKFLQTDPIGTEGGMNLYNYTGNNPLNLTDPSGNCPQCLAFAWKFVPSGIQSKVHIALDGGGLVPAAGIIPDGINAVLYSAEGDYVNAGLSGAAMIPAVGQGVTAAKYAVKYGDEAVGAVAKLGDDALVARGGANITPDSIGAATGTHPSGVTGFSAQSAGTDLCATCTYIPNNQVGVTTVGDVRAAGGDVVVTSGRGNHVTVTGLSNQNASELLSPSVPNPVPKELRK